MIVYAVYVITKDGIELISEKFQAEVSIPDTTLLSALMVAFQQMADSVTTLGVPKKICFEELTYHMQAFVQIQVVVVTNSDDEPSEILSRLGFRFVRQYKSQLHRWDGNQSRFDPFRAVINKVVRDYARADESSSLSPGNFLNAKVMMALPKTVQKTAGAIIAFGSASFSELTEYVNQEESEIKQSLEYLRSKGYIGIRSVDGKNQYFTSISQAP